MPAAPTPRQHEGSAESWFCRDPGLALLHQVQREAIPELTRVFGHSGLYLRPCQALPETLSGNMLAQVLGLYRCGDRFAGALACRDGALPLASGSLSLVYALCVLETSCEPDALVGEIARVLKPGGDFLIKIFQGEGFDVYLKDVRSKFDKVQMRKPSSSRDRSREQYLLGRGFKG